jgi:hypothetical protein
MTGHRPVSLLNLSRYVGHEPRRGLEYRLAGPLAVVVALLCPVHLGFEIRRDTSPPRSGGRAVCPAGPP